MEKNPEDGEELHTHIEFCSQLYAAASNTRSLCRDFCI